MVSALKFDPHTDTDMHPDPDTETWKGRCVNLQFSFLNFQTNTFLNIEQSDQQFKLYI